MIKQSIANEILKAIFSQVQSVSILPNQCYIGLSTTTPNADGSNFTEPSSDTGYERYLTGARSADVTWKMTTPSAGSIQNSDTLYFDKAVKAYDADVTHFGLFEAKTGGTPVFWGELTEPMPIGEGYIAIFPAGNLKVNLT